MQPNLKKSIDIVAPCYNEEGNIRDLYRRLRAVTDGLSHYDFTFLFIDNASTDRTVDIIREIVAVDPRVRAIVNTRNFGPIRSPYWGVLQSRGDATIYMASDLQDPPECIPQFLSQWEIGWKVVLAVKPVSRTGWMSHALRRLYYRILDRISDVPLVRDSTGFGLYDRIVLDHVREIGNPLPYFRGLVCEIGYPIKTIEFEQPRRMRGISKNNFKTLYDVAMLGVISHSIWPVRVASLVGGLIAAVSFCTGIFYGILKLLYWNSFPVGIAPLLIGCFFCFGLLFLFIGMLGEYVGAIHMHLKNIPTVVERERINFSPGKAPVDMSISSEGMAPLGIGSVKADDRI
jgi:glycosyltransferase involved in cell wall biosynthesis